MKQRQRRSRSLRALVFCAAVAAGACGGLDPVNVSVTVDSSVTHQTLVGFGAATAFQAYLLAGRTDDIFQVLFVDSGLDILRLGNWYQNQGQTTTTATPFSDSDAVQIVQKATAARGGTPPKILMSSWTPPAYLKSNGVTRPPFGSGSSAMAGTLIQNGGAYAYADFGDWWARSLQAYAAQGVVPDWVSIQNEPDFFTSEWETCVFGPTEGATVAGIAAAGYGQALDAVSGAIQAASLASPPVLLGPETTGFKGNIVQQYLSGLDPSKLGGIAHHLYGSTDDNPAPDTFNASMLGIGKSGAAEGLPIFMTEYSPNAPTMFDTAWLIENALTVENVSAYLYWELVWSNSTPTTGLVAIAGTSASASYTVTDLYYALKHFARWTDPGWVRVDATSSVSTVRASAFVSPDGTSLTLVLLNTDSQDHTVSVSPGAFSFGTLAVYRSSGDSERTSSVAPESDGSIALPSRAIATVTFTP
ncbi:MAG TPA: glycoside hydrolase family 30 beta sandwich domain-containing protein [Polyangia bacterium]|nr:glycoside hydrolase family 30 beta sandwich domain-containing protein [Polyangia bacterium]